MSSNNSERRKIFIGGRAIKIPNRKQLSKMLECSNCQEILRMPPISCCNNGLHYYCCFCKGYLKNCSKCGNNTNITTNRNLLIEQLLDRCIIACKNWKVGCPFFGCGSEHTEHYPICEFRQIQCPGCQKLLIFKELIPHITAEHKFDNTSENGCKAIKILIPKHLLRSDSNFQFVYWFIHDAVRFSLRILCEGNLIRIFIVAIGDDEVANFWRAKFFLSNFKNDAKLEYDGPVNKILTIDRNEATNLNSISLPQSELQKFLHPHNFEVSNFKISMKVYTLIRRPQLPVIAESGDASKSSSKATLFVHEQPSIVTERGNSILRHFILWIFNFLKNLFVN